MTIDPKVKQPSRWQSAGPIVFLLFLSPFISEILFGSTRVSTSYVFIAEVGAWGCGSLIIRQLARHWYKGWGTILVLGICLAIAEECVIQQTSLAPLAGVDPLHAFGRFFGVNWIYLLWAMWYESIWAVVIPIQLTELLFPSRRDAEWIGWRGFTVSAGIFFVSSFVAWYSWTQVARLKYFHLRPYYPTRAALLIALASIALLGVGSFSLPSGQRDTKSTDAPPSPWAAGISVFALTVPWTLLVLLAYGQAPHLPVVIPIVAGISLIVATTLLVGIWSRRVGWSDLHRTWLILGATLASMLGGFAICAVGGALPVDVDGKAILNGAWLAAMIGLIWRQQARVSAIPTISSRKRNI